MQTQALSGVLAVLVILAGCFADDAEPSQDSSPTSTHPRGTDPTANQGDNNTTNAPPTANLTVDPINGSAPLNVNFTITISDPDGDNLTWSLDADGNGTEDVAGDENNLTANFTYSAEGVYNATLTVSDGLNTVNATVSINVTAGSAEPTVLGTYSGSGTITAYALTNDPNYAAQCPGFLTGQDGVGCVFLEFPLGVHNGRPAIITTNAGAVRAAFWDKCTPTGAGKGFHAGDPGSRFNIPAGAGCAVVWSNNANDRAQTRTFTMTVYDFLPAP